MKSKMDNSETIVTGSLDDMVKVWKWYPTFNSFLPGKLSHGVSKELNFCIDSCWIKYNRAMFFSELLGHIVTVIVTKLLLYILSSGSLANIKSHISCSEGN